RCVTTTRIGPCGRRQRLRRRCSCTTSARGTAPPASPRSSSARAITSISATAVSSNERTISVHGPVVRQSAGRTALGVLHLGVSESPDADRHVLAELARVRGYRLVDVLIV